MTQPYFRARVFRVFFALCGLVLASGGIGATSGEAETTPPAASGQALYTRLHLLPLALQQATVMTVYHQIDLKAAQWPMAKPQDRLDTVKRLAMIFRLLGGVAENAQWSEYAAWCQKKSNIYVGMANGSIPTAEGSKLLDALNAQYDATFASYLRKRFGAKLDVKPTTEYRQLINDMTDSITGMAEQHVAEELAKNGTPLATSKAVTLQQRIGKDVVAKKQMAVAARDALTALPQTERAAALLASGGGLNMLLQRRFAEAKSEPSEQKLEAFRTGDIALMQLADLASRLGFKEAAACHLKESYQLRLLSQGKPAEPAGCRPAAYPSQMELEATRVATGPRSAVLDQLTKEWAKQTYLLSSMTVKFDAVQAK